MAQDIPEAAVVMALLVLAAVFDAVQDKLDHHFDNSIFSRFGGWWNPDTSWKLKWKNGDKKQGERFWLSSTVLAWTTDAWHFFQMLSFSCWQLALAVLISEGWFILVWFIGIKTTFSAAFELAFKLGLKKR